MAVIPPSPAPINGGETSQVGYTFVANGLQPYTVGDTNAKSVFEVIENMYISGPISQMINLIISRNASISVYDENDDVVEDLSRKLNRMFMQPGVNLNTMIRATINDLFIWGISIWNPVWKWDATELKCMSLRHLHPFTFSEYPRGSQDTQHRTYGRLLKGIYYSTIDGKIHYHQRQGNDVVELNPDNIFVVCDPSSQNPDGDSVILPAIPIVDFCNFAWNALGQQMFRTAAPVMFIRITNPKPDSTVNGQFIEGDITYAEKILKDWGKDTGFQVRDNMEIHTIDVKEGSLARSAIEIAAKTIESYISPVGMLGENSSLISGNSDASIRLINNHIQGWANMIKTAIRALPNYYLQHNGYPETWHAEINIPTVTIEDNTIRLNQAKLLAETKTGTVNEIRELLGREGISAEEIAKMRTEWDLVGAEEVPTAN